MCPTQVRRVVTILQRMRATPYRGVDRELFVDIGGIHLESCCSRGYFYIDDQPYTGQQCQELERAALEAARCAEGPTFTSPVESYSVSSIGHSARQTR
ncbi:hypothetical protein CXF37_00015 [Corynebacterium bovis]|nr:hypothetical protein CXF36_00015 [Corynebacterium bovis]RRO85242.1 hypothetical protein CXF37_00015 [Corynebacterium bovis]